MVAKHAVFLPAASEQLLLVLEGGQEIPFQRWCDTMAPTYGPMAHRGSHICQ